MLILMCLHMVSIPLHGQYVSLKSNLLYLGTSTSNMGFEFRLGRKMSLDLWGAYNAWEFKNDMSLKHYLVHPNCATGPARRMRATSSAFTATTAISISEISRLSREWKRKTTGATIGGSVCRCRLRLYAI